MSVLIWLIASSIAGILYRIGGCIWSWVRDWGIAPLFVAYMAYMGAVQGLWQWLSMVLCFFGLAGALSTYRYFLPKPINYNWYHYAMHGFFIGLSAIFYALASGKWIGFGCRTLSLAVFMGIWYFIAKKKDWLHEGGRGFVIIATTPLLAI